MLRPYLDYEEASQLILRGRAKPLTEPWKASVFFFFFNSIFITAEVSAALVMDPKKVKKEKRKKSQGGIEFGSL